MEGDTTVAEFTYDDAGRLETVTRNGQLTASYEYDANGNRLELTTPGGTVTGTYDDQDRLTSYGSALAATAVVGLAGTGGWQLGLAGPRILGGYDPWSRCPVPTVPVTGSVGVGYDSDVRVTNQTAPDSMVRYGTGHGSTNSKRSTSRMRAKSRRLVVTRVTPASRQDAASNTSLMKDRPNPPGLRRFRWTSVAMTSPLRRQAR